MTAEQDFIDRITAGRSPLPVGPGDDAAVLPDGWILSVDTVVEGTHFEPGTDPRRVARKAVGAALSDLAAMGAEPEVLLFAVQLPAGTDAAALADALREAAASFEVLVAGGDTVAAPAGALAVSVTVAGRSRAAPWTRAGAGPGDRLWVSGPLGGSRRSRHLDVRPRLDVSRRLRAASVDVRAAMDLSDGLGLDLPRLCAASGVGARVEGAALPVHADAAGSADPMLAALFDGEDFELLLALGPGTDPAGLGGLTAIGSVVDRGEGLQLVRDGRAQPWPSGGFAHGF